MFRDQSGAASRLEKTGTWRGSEGLGGLLYFAVLDAGSASSDPLSVAVHDSPNRLQIDIPSALRHIVRMADAVAELRPAPAHVTYLRHDNDSPL